MFICLKEGTYHLSFISVGAICYASDISEYDRRINVRAACLMQHSK